MGTFFSIFNFNVIELNSTEKIIFKDLRLARTLLAAVTGFSLAICGVIMQAITENKMSSPFTTGISSAASMGAAFSILFLSSLKLNPETVTIISAFIFASFCSALVFGFYYFEHE